MNFDTHDFFGKKVEEAEKIIESCIGKKGVWASPDRYKHQCWTRDFVIAAEDILLKLGRGGVVKNHLRHLAEKQRPDGQTPILFIDNLFLWLIRKIWQVLMNLQSSFLLTKWFIGFTKLKHGVSVEILTPWTRDSEILFVVGVLKYARDAGDPDFLKTMKPHLEKAVSYIEDKLIRDGLVYGGDWRDTRTELGEKSLLSNNCFLYEMYKLLDRRGDAEFLKNKINSVFWTGSYYRDYPEAEEFDTFGNALAIIFGIADKERSGLIFEKVEELDTSFGYKLNGVTLPSKSREETEIMQRTNQFGVIWPFVNGFMILAALVVGKSNLAKKQFAKWDLLDGFYEWYDPKTGKGYGSRDQLWSAALYSRCFEDMRRL